MVMRFTIVKNFFREIWGSKSRFISIFTIIMVGASSYAGLRTTGPDMKLTADTYFDNQHFMDISAQSSLGILEEDVEEVRSTEGVAAAAGAWSIDAYLHTNEDYIVKVHSLSEGINVPVLKEGRMPESPTECLVGSDARRLFSVAIGDTIQIRTVEGVYEDSLGYSEYTLVGVVDAPNYISLSKGTSTLGNGIVLDFVYLTEDAFSLDYYTDVNILVAGAAEQDTFSDGYTQIVDGMVTRMEELGEIRSQARYDDVIGDAEAKLAEARQELEAAEADKESQLQEAQVKIDDSRREIEEGEAAVADSEADLNSAVASVEADLSSAQSKLNSSEADIRANEAKLNTAKSDLRRSESEYNAAVQETNAQIAAAESQTASNIAAVEAQIPALQSSIREIQSKMVVLEGQIAYIKSTGGDASSVEAQYNAYQGQINQIQNNINAIQGEVSAARNALQSQKSAAQAQLNKAKSDLDAARASVNSSQNAINSAKAQVEDGWNDYRAGQRELETTKRDGEAKIADAKVELEEAKQKLADAEAEYAASEADAEAKLEEARQDLREAQDRVNEIEEGRWYVNSRLANPGYSAFSDDADRITALASVFPVIFFLVAAMVSLTTMTRMVESKRTENGTMRAMGYGKLSIAMIYLMYGLLASLGGSVAGFFFGIHMIPTIIFAAYSELLYTLPNLIIPFEYEYLISSVLISITCVTGATLWACYSSFTETPSSLMKPRTPKPGKRILLEYIGFIWKPMPFKYKVTARNILRYKKRFFMTLIGICGCTGLLIAGFGLRDSIMGVVDIQYGELNLFDMSVTLNESASDESKEKVLEYLDGSDLVSESGLFRMGSTTVTTSKRAAETYYVVPFNLEKMSEFYVLRDRQTGANVPLMEGGVVITEKLSELLGINIGDKITVNFSQPTPITVTGICENYVYHYVFITRDTYKMLTEMSPSSGAGVQPETEVSPSPEMETLSLITGADVAEVETPSGTPAEAPPDTGTEAEAEAESETRPRTKAELRASSIYVKLVDESAYDEVSEYILSNAPSAVSYITRFSVVQDLLLRSMQSIDAAVVIIIVAAAVLAFVVLYNLNNINITERMRELSTIKVMGYYDRNVTAYLSRENLVLTLLGILMVGQVFGMLLHKYLVHTVEIEMMMFAREATQNSYIYSTVLTLFFSLIVGVFVHFSLKAIDMVESVKMPD